MSNIDEKLCGLAIDACSTAQFESFVHSFHAGLIGTSFVPLGGMHDGGADGFEEAMFESSARAGTFLQASKTQGVERKIRQTIKRLREVGREPKTAIFYFSIPLGGSDITEEKLSEELDVSIKIRPKAYICAHINHSQQTAAAYKSHLEPAIYPLLKIGGAGQDREYPFSARTACAFIGQELKRRRGNASLLETISESLIFWALEGTDPDSGKLMSEDEILSRIFEAVPASKQFMRSVIHSKLAALSSKSNPSGRQISWYRKEGLYALRFEERQKILEDNADEIQLFSAIGDEITEIARGKLPERLYDSIPNILKAVRSAIEVIFRKQGLDVGLFLSGGEEASLDGVDIAEELDILASEAARNAEDISCIRDCLADIVRKIIYSPTENQREYMQRLSSTYFVLFALKNEPRIVEYFSGMARNLVLYIGSDLLIKMLSEYHLPPEGQLITNAVKIIKDAGSRLILTEGALDEVFTHLHATVLEFDTYYSRVEGKISAAFIPAIDRILIRAYFYARLDLNTNGSAPKGWLSYISQFCSYEDVRRKKSARGLQLYLCDRYGLDFESKNDMLTKVDRDQLQQLKESIEKEKGATKSSGAILAYNDALQALRIFSKRNELSESTVPNPYGYRTWWLTHERATERASSRAFGSKMPRFVMRPEFLLNYIGLLPSKSEVVQSYKNVFPSILAVSLGRRAPANLVHEVLTAASESIEVDESRARVMLSEFADQLKADKLRIYETQINAR
ncbi:hypothetical protein DWF04_013340 [Cereibacter sphaeroides f. sp. denitrificans]